MIEITSLDHNGRGIAKINDKIVFVENALPGEIVEIKILNEKKNLIEADVLKYIKKSNLRIDSPCPYYDKCGGCDLLHLCYKEQLKFKQEKICNIIKKYLNKNIKINDIVKCDNNFNYRNKVTFQVKEKIGFYKNKSYDLIPIDKCLNCNDVINNAISYLKKLNLKDIEKITCRTNKLELMIILETKNENINIDPIKDICNSIFIKNNNKYKLVYGDNYITQKLDKYKYLVSPDSFFQVNLNICEKLYNKINEYVGSNKNILDLYCGTGSIGIYVSQSNNVIGIEINEFAIMDANKNKKLNSIENIKFICGDSSEKIQNLNFNPDIIIVDPPRSGLKNITIANILKMNPKQIIYVSCDPMTLVRDLNILSKNYNIEEITPFDMFPNTKHVECLVNLKKI